MGLGPGHFNILSPIFLPISSLSSYCSSLHSPHSLSFFYTFFSRPTYLNLINAEAIIGMFEAV